MQTMKRTTHTHSIDGNALAYAVTLNVKRETARFIRKKGIPPGLGIILVGDDPASHLYVGIKLRMARTLGFYCRRVVLPQHASERDVMLALHSLQRSKRINGVIIQIPLPRHISINRVCSQIDPRKDIDCLNPDNLKALSEGRTPPFWPPTAESVVHAIRSVQSSLKKKKVVVVGRGFFAKQIAALCFAMGAHLELISSSAHNLKKKTRTADILISAIGRPKSITGDMIKKGCVVIDVGVAKVNGVTVGDIDFESVVQKAGAVSPVPGGIGPITVAMLMKNVLKAAKGYKDCKKA